MTIRELPGVLNRTQQARWFKIAATVAFLLVLGTLYGWYAIAVASGRIETVTEAIDKLGAATQSDASTEVMREVLQNAASTGVGFGAAVIAVVGVAMIWLGLGLTYLLLGLVAAAVAGPLAMFESTGVYARLIVGVVVLSASFTALMQGLRVLFSGAGPVMSVARNMLTEAVRMKMSLVLIVLLILGLAVLPGMLDADQPLRYRVQTFFQYSVSGTFWVLAALSLAFGVSSITGEQRSKVLWQTITKPVAPWQYLLGKWLGLVGLNAILLLVAASGIFLFAEYLRQQPAVGESHAYIDKEGTGAPTEDRFILESRVLTARKSASIEIPPELSIDAPEFKQAVDDYIKKQRLTDPEFAQTPDELAKVVSDLHEGELRAYRSIPAGGRQTYRIPGLEGAAERNAPITLSLRIDAGGNRPDMFYNISFVLITSDSAAPIVRKMGLGYYHNIPLSPRAIGPDGALLVQIYNGGLVQDSSGAIGIVPNPSALSIPDNGLEVSYEAGGYRMNFFRVILVLWVKLAFLAMIGVFASTFLSFPVACLVAFGVFLLAEMSGYLVYAADTYAATDRQGDLVWYKWAVGHFTGLVGHLFSVYSDLKPVRRLVDGRLLPWSAVVGGTGVLAGVTALLYACAVYVFRKRELAIYSGQ
ncbi:MAG: hypothetical protein H6810_05375 [Phycisphaeraceae bacterium]|nr:MAG: hypothetical protein H6810_05375 [Phycisphaeraceae bacterium]